MFSENITFQVDCPELEFTSLTHPLRPSEYYICTLQHRFQRIFSKDSGFAFIILRAVYEYRISKWIICQVITKYLPNTI